MINVSNPYMPYGTGNRGYYHGGYGCPYGDRFAIAVEKH